MKLAIWGMIGVAGIALGAYVVHIRSENEAIVQIRQESIRIKEEQKEAQRASERSIFSELDSARSAIRERIGKWIGPAKGFVIVNEESATTAISANASWLVDCRFSMLEIKFLADVSSESDVNGPLVGSGPTLLLSMDVPADACIELSRLAATEMVEIMGRAATR